MVFVGAGWIGGEWANRYIAVQCIVDGGRKIWTGTSDATLVGVSQPNRNRQIIYG